MDNRRKNSLVVNIHRVLKFTCEVKLSHQNWFELKSKLMVIAKGVYWIWVHLLIVMQKPVKMRGNYRLLMCCKRKDLKEWPLASIILGNIEMGVRPGKVFISFR